MDARFSRGSGRACVQVLQAALNFVRRLAGGPSGVTTFPVNSSFVQEIAKLFDAWCRESLYRGPKCYGEPHGVIIGCAVVSSGRIVSVDPWGGQTLGASLSASSRTGRDWLV